MCWQDSDGSDSCIVYNFRSGGRQIFGKGRGGGNSPPTPVAESATSLKPKTRNQKPNTVQLDHPLQSLSPIFLETLLLVQCDRVVMSTIMLPNIRLSQWSACSLFLPDKSGSLTALRVLYVRRTVVHSLWAIQRRDRPTHSQQRRVK